MYPSFNVPDMISLALIGRTEQTSDESNPDPIDPATMHQANRKFSVNHAMSIHLNMIALVASICYGFSLASGILSSL
jgi:hypothetical protein